MCRAEKLYRPVRQSARALETFAFHLAKFSVRHLSFSEFAECPRISATAARDKTSRSHLPNQVSFYILDLRNYPFTPSELEIWRSCRVWSSNEHVRRSQLAVLGVLANQYASSEKSENLYFCLP